MKKIQIKLILGLVLITVSGADLFSQTVLPKTKSKAGTKDITANDSTRNVLLHHLKAFQDNELDLLMSDYTNESVLITREATYEGPQKIRSFFTGLMTHFPKNKTVFELDKMVVKDGLVYIVWHSKTPSVDVPLGSDTFVIKGGKIYQQTFVGQMNFTK